MRDDMENVAELLRTQRAQLASRLKTPWWYVAATAFAWAGGWLELPTWWLPQRSRRRGVVGSGVRLHRAGTYR